MVSVLIIPELAGGGTGGAEISIQGSNPGRDLNPEPLYWQFSMITTRPPCTPIKRLYNWTCWCYSFTKGCTCKLTCREYTEVQLQKGPVCRHGRMKSCLSADKILSMPINNNEQLEPVNTWVSSDINSN